MELSSDELQAIRAKNAASLFRVYVSDCHRLGIMKRRLSQLFCLEMSLMHMLALCYSEIKWEVGWTNSLTRHNIFIYYKKDASIHLQEVMCKFHRRDAPVVDQLDFWTQAGELLAQTPA